MGYYRDDDHPEDEQIYRNQVRRKIRRAQADRAERDGQCEAHVELDEEKEEEENDEDEEAAEVEKRP